MPTLPIRELGSVGVITDASPYSIPITAVSKAVNVLFDENRVQRAPVFKTLYEAVRSIATWDEFSAVSFDASTGTFENIQGELSKEQRFISSYATSEREAVLVCDVDGIVREYPDGAVANVSPADTTAYVENDNPWTHCQVAGLSVLTRKGMVPYVRNLTTEPVYNFMRNDWNPNHTAAVGRAFGDFIILMNIQKTADEFPTMVKWCHPLQYSPNPASGISWDPASTTLLSGENTLSEMKNPIRDGLALQNSFIIYSQDQVWNMDFTRDNSVFAFRRLFPTGGILATNCVAEAEGMHYVFGEDDLYAHDGVQKMSIGDERVRRHVYQTMDRDKKDSFYVHHDSSLNLIYYCYVSKENDLAFKGSRYCNKAAVFNYRNKTWSFMDLPNTVGAAETNLSLNQAGYSPGSIAQTPKVSVMLSVTDPLIGLTESRVLALDNPDVGAVQRPAHPETIKRAFVERTGIDMFKEAGMSIRAYKIINNIIPQLDYFHPTGRVFFQIGASERVDGEVYWQEPVEFDHTTEVKVDSRASGRYLAFRVYCDRPAFFRLGGMDVNVTELGKR